MAMSVKPRQVDEKPLENMGPVVRELEPHEEQLVRRLDRFQAPYLQEKLLIEGEVTDPADYQHRFTEFKKYAALTDFTDASLPMPSEEVDEVWHQFILFTPQYRNFCKQQLGRFLHHVPHTSHTPVNPAGYETFVNSYEETFGELPEIWDTVNKSECDGDSDDNDGGCYSHEGW